jgi:hypothetical protein
VWSTTRCSTSRDTPVALDLSIGSDTALRANKQKARSLCRSSGLFGVARVDYTGNSEILGWGRGSSRNDGCIEGLLEDEHNDADNPFSISERYAQNARASVVLIVPIRARQAMEWLRVNMIESRVSN